MRASVMQDAAKRMTPVDVMFAARLPHSLLVFLDDLVGKQKHDKDKRNHQKCAQYYVFGHDNLLDVKRFAIAL